MDHKDSRYRSTAQIKILAIQKADIEESDSEEILRVSCKKNFRAGVFPARKSNNKKNPNHGGNQRYCVLYNKAVMIEHKYMSHISETCFGNRSDQVCQ